MAGMMDDVPQTHIEREDKYDVAAGFRVPDLTELVPSGGHLVRVDAQLRAVYYDTAAGDLQAARVTLRRREGGDDAGWHLKLPAGAARTEIQLPLGGSDLPAELAALTVGLRRARAVQPIAILRTARSAHRIYDESGALWLEIADDRVHSVALGPGATRRLLRPGNADTDPRDSPESVDGRTVVGLPSAARPSASC